MPSRSPSPAACTPGRRTAGRRRTRSRRTAPPPRGGRPGDGGRSSLADREHRLEVVLARRPRRRPSSASARRPASIAIRRRHDVAQVLVARDADEGDEVPLARDRVDLTDAVELGQLRRRASPSPVALGLDQDDRVGHVACASPGSRTTTCESVALSTSALNASASVSIGGNVSKWTGSRPAARRSASRPRRRRSGPSCSGRRSGSARRRSAVAPAGQRQVAEQRRVAEVVDTLAAEARRRGRPACVTVPFGDVAVCHAGTSRAQPQSNSTVPPRFGSWTAMVLAEVARDLARELAIASDRRAGALGDGDGVAEVVDVAVRQQDRVGADARRPRRRPSGCPSGRGRRGRSCPRRVSSPRRRGPGSGCSPFRWSSSSGLVEPERGSQLACQLEAHGDADQHAQARLLGDQDAERAQALLGILARAPRFAICRCVGVLEPAALVERLR